MGRTFIITGLIVLCIGLIGSGVYSYRGIFSEATQSEDSKVFDIENIGELNIVSTSANVEIVRGTGDQIKAILTSKTKGNASPYYLETEQSGEVLEVRAEQKNEWRPFNWSSAKLLIELPAHQYKSVIVHTSSGNLLLKGVEAYELETITSSGSLKVMNVSVEELKVSSSSGSIKVTGASGDAMAVSSNSGSIELTNLSGDVTVQSTSGSQNIRDVKGSRLVSAASSGSVKLDGVTQQAIEVETSSGRISLKDAVGEVKVKSSSGGASLEMKEGGKPIEVQSTSGSVSVKLPKRAEFELDARSSSGHINIGADEFQYSAKDQNDNRKVGSVGDDGPIIMLSTSSGSITINN